MSEKKTLVKTGFQIYAELEVAYSDEYAMLIGKKYVSVEGLVVELQKLAVDRNDIDVEWENNECKSLGELEALRKKKFVSLDVVLARLGVSD